jgi:hypothetical protein
MTGTRRRATASPSPAASGFSDRQAGGPVCREPAVGRAAQRQLRGLHTADVWLRRLGAIPHVGRRHAVRPLPGHCGDRPLGRNHTRLDRQDDVRRSVPDRQVWAGGGTMEAQQGPNKRNDGGRNATTAAGRQCVAEQRAREAKTAPQEGTPPRPMSPLRRMYPARFKASPPIPQHGVISTVRTLSDAQPCGRRATCWAFPGPNSTCERPADAFNAAGPAPIRSGVR